MVTKTMPPSNTDNLLLIFDADRKIPTRGGKGGGSKWKLPETRFTDFPVLYVDPRTWISRSALETND